MNRLNMQTIEMQIKLNNLIEKLKGAIKCQKQ